MISLLNHAATIATVAGSVSSSGFRLEIYISRRKADMEPAVYRGGGHLRRGYINQGIKQSKALSVNVVDESWLRKAAEAGSVSGRNADKSTLFDYTIGDTKAPIINEAKLSVECVVADIYEIGALENFVVTVVNTFADEDTLSESGDKPDYEKFKPVLFEMPNYTFLRTGETLGDCKSFMKK